MSSMRTPGLASLAMVLLTSCSSGGVPPAVPSATATPRPTPQPTLQSALPTASQATTASPTSTQATKAPTGIALDRCVNESGIYAVSYPSRWYSNGGGLSWDSWDDCSLFGPQPFLTADDPAIAIVLLAQPIVPWSDPFAPLTGEFEGYSVLRDEATTIGGRDAWVREFELTTTVSGNHNAGDQELTYAVDIGDGWFLSASAGAAPDDFEEASHVLTSMLDTLEVLEIPAP
jgi:hypothetical protein